MNIACGIEYDGTEYHGFQRQPVSHGVTIQGTLEAAIARICGEAVIVHGAGRTDAGVHASGQVINFHTGSRLTPAVWMRALNAVLPETVAVRWAEAVPEGFHARFSAVSRSYRYSIWNDVAPSALLARYSYYYPRVLAVELMQEVCGMLVGRKDFGAFGRNPNAPSYLGRGDPLRLPLPRRGSPVWGQDAIRGMVWPWGEAGWRYPGTVRTMLEASCIREDGRIYCDFTANAFLTGMVRRMVGTLLLVGEKRMTLAEFEALVEREGTQGVRDKSAPYAGRAAPAHGLCLVRVNYPEEFGVKQ